MLITYCISIPYHTRIIQVTQKMKSGKYKHKFGSTQAYTIIELVLVVILLGILTAVAIPRFYKIQEDARYASFKSCIGALKSGISNAYSLKKGEFPTVDELTANSSAADDTTFEIMGAADFELSRSENSGAELIGNLSAQPAEGSWEAVFIYAPSVAAARY